MNESSFADILRKWWANASAIILIVIAACGAFYDALHRLGFEEILGRFATPEQVLIGLVALLCGGLGAERLLTLKKIEADIEDAQVKRAAITDGLAQVSHDIAKLLTRIEKLRAEIVTDFKDTGRKEDDIFAAVKQINRAEALVGPREIEDAALRLVDECGDSEKIKATGQYRIGDGLSNGYFQHVAARVAKAQRRQGGMEYHVVVAANQPTAHKEDDARVAAFKDAKVEDRLRMRRAKQPWPFEVIIGGHSMIIALLGGDERSQYEVAVKITDSEFVEKAADWYRQVAWEEADRL